MVRAWAVGTSCGRANLDRPRLSKLRRFLARTARAKRHHRTLHRRHGLAYGLGADSVCDDERLTCGWTPRARVLRAARCDLAGRIKTLERQSDPWQRASRPEHSSEL